MTALSLHCVAPTPVLVLEQNDDVTLLRGLIAEDPAAWRELNRRHGRQIQQAIIKVTSRFRSVLGGDAADEIYSRFCLQLLQNDKRKLKSFDPERGVRLVGFLCMLATHCAYDLLRSRRRDPRADAGTELDSCVSAVPDPYSCCAARERAEQVTALMQDMSERDREFVMLYFGEGLSAEAVADQMGISINTVYSKKHKLRAKLVALLSAQNLAA
jgi:RNA polymerase sigma-70 factor (ECF subfamily)